MTKKARDVNGQYHKHGLAVPPTHESPTSFAEAATRCNTSIARKRSGVVFLQSRGALEGFFFTFQRRVCRMRAYYINTHLAESRANNDDRSCGPLASHTLPALS